MKSRGVFSTVCLPGSKKNVLEVRTAECYGALMKGRRWEPGRESRVYMMILPAVGRRWDQPQERPARSCHRRLSVSKRRLEESIAVDRTYDALADLWCFDGSIAWVVLYPTKVKWIYRDDGRCSAGVAATNRRSLRDESCFTDTWDRARGRRL